MNIVKIIQGHALDVLRTLPEKSAQTCVTSPPYWGLRNYGVEGQIGLEDTPEAYVQNLVALFRQVRRVLRDDGTVWLNLGDSYVGSGRVQGGASTIQDNNRGSRFSSPQRPTNLPGLKSKDLVGIPWRVAFALQADGWYLRSDIIWAKPNPMPESVTDRPTRSHETIFLLTKSREYYYDADAVLEPFQGDRWGGDEYEVDGNEDKQVKGLGRTRNCRPNPNGRNRRDVWTVATVGYKDAHFATYPEALITPCILAGTSAQGACATCGAPAIRQLEQVNPKARTTGRHAKQEAKNVQHGRLTTQRPDGLKAEDLGVWKTVGWDTGCGHEGDRRPCTILDPFGGAGTTGLVAAKHGRNAILVELNPDYVAMAARRIEAEVGLLAEVRVG